MRIVVVGAGVAGLSSAVYLLRDGHQVTVLDPLPPAGGASFGNAGMISPTAHLPQALPGMLRQVPGWLMDPLGPLAIRPRAVPRALPWLLRWIGASREPRVWQIAEALHDLHRESFESWAELLGAVQMAALFRRQGQMHAWEGGAPPKADLASALRAHFGTETRVLDGAEMRDLFPGLSPTVTRGLMMPDNGHVTSPAKAVTALAEVLQAEGGTLLAQRVMKLIPAEGGGWLVMANSANHRADVVVVAAGAWSTDMLKALGIRLPVQAERGYHVSLPDPSVTLPMPISMKSRGFAMTPMEEGLRCAGTVEIAKLEDPPDERRAHKLLSHAQALFPGLSHGPVRLWMGSRPSTPDSLPVIGPVARRPGLFLCTGHGHFGMTAGPPSGRLLAQLVRANDPAGDPRYGLARFG
jgi:D-amino-acid dehydrogenase